MEAGNYTYMKLCFTLLIVFYLFTSFSEGDNTDIATPGIGLTKVKIGETSFDEVKIVFGKTKKIKPKKGKKGEFAISWYSLNYSNLGLGFIAIDKNNIVCEIEIFAPYKVKTNLGVALGTEKRTVLKLYGKPKMDSGGLLEYEGITFYFENGIRCFGQPDIGTEQDLNRQVHVIKLYSKSK